MAWLTDPTGLAARFWSNRRRFAPAVLILALGAIGGEVLSAWPHETEVRYDFGPEHRSVRVARIAYVLDGDEAKGARFEWSDGAPEVFRHVVELEPGRYDVVADIDGDDGQHARIERALSVPADGVVRLTLFDEAYANANARSLP
jgi:hypothetical protein